MLAAILELGAPSPGADITLVFGPYTATVVVADGDVFSVDCGPHHGEDALFRLLLSPPRGIRQSKRERPPTGHGLGSGQGLLEGFARFVAGLERQTLPLGGLDRRWAMHFPALLAIVSGLPEDVKRVVRLADGTRDVRRLVAESPLPHDVTVRVLLKLLSAGALLRADVDDEGRAVVADEHDGSASENDDGISADRRWQRAKEATATPPAPTPTTTATTATATPTTATPTPATPTTATPPAAPRAPTPSTPETTPVMVPSPQARASAAAAASATAAAGAAAASAAASATTTTAETAPITLDRHKIAGAQALPQTLPKPGPELQAWLGDEHAAFFDAAPKAPSTPPSWPWWQLVVLLAAGAIIGVVAARLFG